MSLVRLKHVLSAFAVVVMTSGIVASASAAPLPGFVRHVDHARPVQAQNVHWEYRHHHRYWVPDHHRAYR